MSESIVTPSLSEFSSVLMLHGTFKVITSSPLHIGLYTGGLGYVLNAILC